EVGGRRARRMDLGRRRPEWRVRVPDRLADWRGGAARMRPTVPLALGLVLTARAAGAQAAPPRTLRAAALSGVVVVDGGLDEQAWLAAHVAPGFLQADPIEGAPPGAATEVRVLAGPKAILVGIECEDDDPAGIVSFSKARDAVLTSEDHVRLVFGPFLDGRSGYVFAVNPSGARYD